MNRVLSVETSRSGALATEFITKRLCCSCILTAAFLAMLGGYFLGEFTAKRAENRSRANYIEIMKKIGTVSEIFRATFQNKCDFSNSTTDSFQNNNIFLDELVTCFKNG
ncbi:unnamed protein product [Brassicogethes aeneus]|uniref:Uncharacterized protein n=1 Tax=Brassicogethes aeneus TaxID=1431903 RepID=A0A9P0AWB3_BRAAE|nr:unnamed protein product [Brassicogethes aeneus]